MSSFILDLIQAEGAPIERDVSFGKKKGKQHFRRLSSGEMSVIWKGVKIDLDGARPRSADLEFNHKQKQLIVLYSVCDAKGDRIFQDLPSVEAIPNVVLEVFAQAAQEVNGVPGEDDDLGKP